VSGVTVRLMSDGELTWLEVLRDLDQRRLTTEAAGQLLGLERRQVFRLLKAYRTAGPTGLISKQRGRPGNRRKPAQIYSRPRGTEGSNSVPPPGSVWFYRINALDDGRN
jgi:hypothetical protein